MKPPVEFQRRYKKLWLKINQGEIFEIVQVPTFTLLLDGVYAKPFRIFHLFFEYYSTKLDFFEENIFEIGKMLRSTSHPVIHTPCAGFCFVLKTAKLGSLRV